MIIEFISKSEKETEKIATRLAKKLKGGEVIALMGNLGAGKTIFVRGLAKSFGIKKTITSPSFVLMKIYKTRIDADQNLPAQAGADRRGFIRVNQRRNPRKSAKWLCHVDAYRLKNEKDLIEIGILDWLGKRDTITVIEWAEKVKKILPKTAIKIKIRFGRQKNIRIFVID